MSDIQVSAFRWVPPAPQGLVRDLRVRWALEEAGRPYEARLIDFKDQHTPGYLELQPFGQVPAFQQGDLKLFESGAIVLHIAESSDALMPAEKDAQAKVKTWMFAALNTIEPPIMMMNIIDLRLGKSAAARELRTEVVKFVSARLDSLAGYLGDQHYLVANRFTAADLLMSAVLRILRDTDLVTTRPTLEAYKQRCEARPAFQKALADQLNTFAANAPAA